MGSTQVGRSVWGINREVIVVGKAAHLILAGFGPRSSRAETITASRMTVRGIPHIRDFVSRVKKKSDFKARIRGH